jgi:hypothetical protein
MVDRLSHILVAVRISVGKLDQFDGTSIAEGDRCPSSYLSAPGQAIRRLGLFPGFPEILNVNARCAVPEVAVRIQSFAHAACLTVAS